MHRTSIFTWNFLFRTVLPFVFLSSLLSFFFDFLLLLLFVLLSIIRWRTKTFNKTTASQRMCVCVCSFIRIARISIYRFYLWHRYTSQIHSTLNVYAGCRCKQENQFDFQYSATDSQWWNQTKANIRYANALRLTQNACIDICIRMDLVSAKCELLPKTRHRSKWI